MGGAPLLIGGGGGGGGGDNRGRVISFRCTRVYDDVHMFRHDGVPYEADTESLLQYTQPLGYHSFQTVIMQERQNVSAGNRPEVMVTRFVISARMRGQIPERI